MLLHMPRAYLGYERLVSSRGSLIALSYLAGALAALLILTGTWLGGGLVALAVGIVAGIGGVVVATHARRQPRAGVARARAQRRAAAALAGRGRNLAEPRRELGQTSRVDDDRAPICPACGV